MPHARTSRRLPAFLAACLLASACQPGTPVEGTASSPAPSPTPTPLEPGSAILAGQVQLPAAIVSEDGKTLRSNAGGILYNNGGAIIYNNGGAIIYNNGGAIIYNNGGAILHNNGGNYELRAAAGPQAPLRDAYLYLTDRDERFFINARTRRAFAATTNGEGAYRFPFDPQDAFPVGQDVLVHALIDSTYRLSGFLSPGLHQNTLRVDLASTLATEYLRGEAYRSGRSLGSFERRLFDRAVEQTAQAIDTGDIEAVRVLGDDQGRQVPVGTFDLRAERVGELRNQYAIAISAAPKANALIRQLSDTWARLFGYRPAAVTTVAGNGRYPEVHADPARPERLGLTTRDGQPGAGSAMGANYGIAVSPSGDVFVSGATNTQPARGFIRWIRPDGTVASVWLPNYDLVSPAGLAIERERDGETPLTLLVTDHARGRVFRVYAVDRPVMEGAEPKWPMEPVAGAQTVFGPVAAPLLTVFTQLADPASPFMPELGGSTPVLASVPAFSRWRLSDEGPRRYPKTGAPIPQPARYAFLNQPSAVAVDELGNIYIADSGNARVRMIPKSTGSYFGHRQAIDDDADGIVDRFGEPAAMQAGCLYTIAGHPAWDPARSATNPTGHWVGGYTGDGGPAQAAQLAIPLALQFRDGWLYVADAGNEVIRRISRDTGVIETYARGFTLPTGLAFDGQGRLFVADQSGSLRMVAADGAVTAVAGRTRRADEATRFTGDGDARFGVDIPEPAHLAVDADGNVLFTDLRQLRTRKLWRQWD